MYALQTQSVRRDLQRAIAAVGVLITVAGCGESSPWETVYKTTGQLLYKGQPVSGAQVTLYPTDTKAPESIRPTAVTNQEGRFILSTHRREDGAPAGEYRVAVVWHPLVDKGSGPSRGPNKLPARYATPDTSALQVRVAEAETSLPPLELK